MGTLLYTPNWVSLEDSVIERSSVFGVAIGWFTNCIVQNGPDIILREGVYGGYQARITFTEEFWSHTSSAWSHAGIVENLYAMFPGTTTPISAGLVNRSWGYDPLLNVYFVVVAFQPNDGHYTIFKMPQALENAGSPNMTYSYPSTFRTEVAHPGVIYPAPYC